MWWQLNTTEYWSVCDHQQWSVASYAMVRLWPVCTLALLLVVHRWGNHYQCSNIFVICDSCQYYIRHIYLLTLQPPLTNDTPLIFHVPNIQTQAVPYLMLKMPHIYNWYQPFVSFVPSPPKMNMNLNVQGKKCQKLYFYLFLIKSSLSLRP